MVSDSGGRKNSGPVPPPRFTERAPAAVKRFQRISTSEVPPFDCTPLAECSVKVLRAIIPRWQPTWSTPLPDPLPPQRAKALSSTK